MARQSTADGAVQTKAIFCFLACHADILFAVEKIVLKTGLGNNSGFTTAELHTARPNSIPVTASMPEVWPRCMALAAILGRRSEFSPWQIASAKSVNALETCPREASRRYVRLMSLVRWESRLISNPRREINCRRSL